MERLVELWKIFPWLTSYFPFFPRRLRLTTQRRRCPSVATLSLLLSHVPSCAQALKKLGESDKHCPQSCLERLFSPIRAIL